MKNVLVFKTSVTNSRQLKLLEPLLNNILDQSEKWNFDLEDCDHILRVEAPLIKTAQISESLDKFGFNCVDLEDMVPLIQLT